MKHPNLPILCDLDGTLIDSTQSVVAAFRWWAELRGLPGDAVERIPFGCTSTDAAAALAPHLDAEEEGAILDERQRLDTEGVVALPGAHRLLSDYTPLAVVTSCPTPLAAARLEAAGLPAPPLLLTPECWTRGKPDPEPYLRGAAALERNPADCIVIEDTPVGVTAGVRACMRVIAVLTTHRRPQLPGAAAYIQSLLELPAILPDLMRD